MEWENNNNHHHATDDERYPRDHFFSVDTFLFGALSRIGDAYSYSNCLAIYFYIKSGESLHVFDSPKDLANENSAKVTVQLTSAAFTRHCQEAATETANEYGDNSDELKRTLLTLDDLTWNAIRKSFNNGKGRMQLDKFSTSPSLIMLVNGDSELAHDLLTGKRIALPSASIDKSAAQNCQCRYCKHQVRKLGKLSPAPPKPSNLSYFIETIDYGDFEEIESARDVVQPEDIAPLVAEYWKRTDWTKKRNITTILMDQHTDEMTEMMLDFLRAPEDIIGDENELAKAVAIGFAGEKYRIATTYYSDRDLLQRDVNTVLKAKGFEIDS